MKKKLSDIIIRKELYPRDKINESKVEEYKQYISVMPPIIINQDNILIDGAHRLHANKQQEQEEIEVSVVKTKDDDDLFLKAVELNSKHGYQMNQKEKKKYIITLFKKTITGDAKTFDIKRLKETFSIPDSTFSDWTKDLNEELEAQRLQKILDLYLQNMTQEEIGGAVGLSQKQIGIKLNDLERKFKELYQKPELEIDIKYNFLKEKIDKLYQFKPLLYNIWNQQSYDSDNTHFGKFPFIFMENLIYYYTEPFDIVYDPFAGGGTTIDVCEKWLRKYYASDLNPIKTRSDIKKWDINKGLPKDLPKPKFVFLDPPYWLQAKEKYSKDKEDLANMNLEDFYNSIMKFMKEVKKKLTKDGKIALVIQSSQWKNDLILEDHPFEIAKRMDKLGFKIQQRIICPYSTEQYNAQQVIKAKENKICLQIYRDIIVFELKQ